MGSFVEEVKNLRLWFRLRRLAKGGAKYRYLGICGNIADIENRPVGFVCDNSKDWEYYSGKPPYPVPASKTNSKNTFEAYRSHYNKWDFTTEYGKLRQDLCFHLIKKLGESSNLCKLASKLC